MPALMTRFLKNRAGATAIEYALIGTLISIVVIGGFTLLANTVGQRYNDVAAQVQQVSEH